MDKKSISILVLFADGSYATYPSGLPCPEKGDKVCIDGKIGVVNSRKIIIVGSFVEITIVCDKY